MGLNSDSQKGLIASFVLVQLFLLGWVYLFYLFIFLNNTWKVQIWSYQQAEWEL